MLGVKTSLGRAQVHETDGQMPTGVPATGRLSTVERELSGGPTGTGQPPRQVSPQRTR